MAIGTQLRVTPGYGLIISRKGPINMDEFYRSVIPWFGRYKYDFTEKEHTEKDRPHGNELLMKWVSDRKIDDYMQYIIEIDFMITGLRKIGDIYTASTKINLRAYINLDYNSEFQKTPFKRFLFFVYNNVLIKRRIITHKMKLYRELMDLHDLMKNLLEHYR